MLKDQTDKEITNTGGNNVVAYPFAIVAEISKEGIEESVKEDFQTIIQKNTAMSILKELSLFNFMPFSLLQWVAEAS